MPKASKKQATGLSSRNRDDLVDYELARLLSGDEYEGWLMLQALSPEQLEYLRFRKRSGAIDQRDIANARLALKRSS